MRSLLTTALLANIAIGAAMSVARRLPPGSRLPKLVVFDLDNTLWLPELYQHNKRQRGRPPVADQDVKLLPGAVNALREMLTCEEWQGCDIAVASRTNQGDWARALLESFPAPGADASRSLASVIKYQEIYTGTKIPHFRSLQSSSGLDFSDMLFFDDSRGGRYGNCEPVAALGVCSVPTQSLEPSTPPFTSKFTPKFTPPAYPRSGSNPVDTRW
jgi:magnesium-dependent phosphatase 1